MEGKKVLNHFGIELEEEPVSIYPFSPVYKIQKNHQQFIIKKTQRPLRKAQNLMQFITLLHASGVDVVTPIIMEKYPNPQEIENDVFVMYPFIEGFTYSAKKEEIYTAGQLLGKIHALSSPTNDYELPVYDGFDFNNIEVIESMLKIRKHIHNANRDLSLDLLEQELLRAVQQQTQLQMEPLPYVATPYDYKANNLIYRPTPYLIDPDHASWVPRILDLALVLLLFHNELDTAPGCIFTAEQWQLFLSGYSEYITLTALEKEQWQAALRHVFLDEVLWLMAEYEEDWVNDKQYELFKSLIRLLGDVSAYSIDNI